MLCCLNWMLALLANQLKNLHSILVSVCVCVFVCVHKCYGVLQDVYTGVVYVQMMQRIQQLFQYFGSVSGWTTPTNMAWVTNYVTPLLECSSMTPPGCYWVKMESKLHHVCTMWCNFSIRSSVTGSPIWIQITPGYVFVTYYLYSLLPSISSPLISNNKILLC